MPTSIEWCDETFNPWWGCAEVSPGCGHCYARTWARFTRAKVQLWPEHGQPATEHVVAVTGDAYWRTPLKWARELPEKLGRRPRVFTASMADVFEPHPDLVEPRKRLLDLIEETPELDWLVLTKRPDVMRDHYFAGGWTLTQNLWLGTSIENARYTWRADVLREIPAAVRFISAEPLLGSLYDGRSDEDAARLSVLQGDRRGDGQLDEQHAGQRSRDSFSLARSASDSSAAEPEGSRRIAQHRRSPLDLTDIDWVIIGGESGRGARPFHLEHAREIVRAARHEGWTDDGHPYIPRPSAAVFVKQLGAKPTSRKLVAANLAVNREWIDWPLKLRDSKGGDMDEWPADLRIREFPRSMVPA